MVTHEGWCATELSDLLEQKALFIQTGPFGTVLRASEYAAHGTPVVSVREIKNGFIQIFEETPRVHANTIKRLPQFILKYGDLVFARKGSVDRCALINKCEDGYFLGSDGIRLRIVSSVLLPQYLIHYFHSHTTKNYLNQSSYGTTMAGLNERILASIPLCYPREYKEQTAIAEALSNADSLIASLQKLIAKKKAIKQGAMQELLTGKRRLPGFSKKWKDKKIGAILDVAHGKNQSAVEDSRGKYPILATGGIIGYATAFLYNKESVLIGRKGTINRPQFVNQPFWTIDTLFYTIIKPNFSAKFVYYKFLLIDWMLYNEASGVPSLNATAIENIEISIPDFDEQMAIAQILSDMDAEIEQLEDKLSKYQHIKQGMMQELLTGRIRLVDKVKTRTHDGDASIMSGIAALFYSEDDPEKYPLGRKKVQKLMYITLRREGYDVSDFMKMAAGPYSPNVRYNSEPIAIERGYIITEEGDIGTKFIRGNNADEAKKNMLSWVPQETIHWLLSNFRRIGVNDLELFATVDMAICDLREMQKPVSVQSIKELIHSIEKWREKLEKPYFSDQDIQRAISKCREFFGE